MAGTESRNALRMLCGAVLIGTLTACAGQQSKDVPLDTLTAEEIYKRGEFLLEDIRNGPSAR